MYFTILLIVSKGYFRKEIENIFSVFTIELKLQNT